MSMADKIYLVETKTEDGELFSVDSMFLDDKDAVEYAKQKIKNFSSWVEEMPVPYPIYIKYINDITGHDEWILKMKAEFQSYTKEDWQKSHELYYKHKYDGILEVCVNEWCKDDNTNQMTYHNMIYNQRAESVSGKVLVHYLAYNT